MNKSDYTFKTMKNVKKTLNSADNLFKFATILIYIKIDIDNYFFNEKYEKIGDFIQNNLKMDKLYTNKIFKFIKLSKKTQPIKTFASQFISFIHFCLLEDFTTQDNLIRLLKIQQEKFQQLLNSSHQQNLFKKLMICNEQQFGKKTLKQISFKPFLQVISHNIGIIYNQRYNKKIQQKSKGKKLIASQIQIEKLILDIQNTHQIQQQEKIIMRYYEVAIQCLFKGEISKDIVKQFISETKNCLSRMLKYLKSQEPKQIKKQLQNIKLDNNLIRIPQQILLTLEILSKTSRLSKFKSKILNQLRILVEEKCKQKSNKSNTDIQEQKNLQKKGQSLFYNQKKITLFFFNLMLLDPSKQNFKEFLEENFFSNSSQILGTTLQDLDIIKLDKIINISYIFIEEYNFFTIFELREKYFKAIQNRKRYYHLEVDKILKTQQNQLIKKVWESCQNNFDNLSNSIINYQINFADKNYGTTLVNKLQMLEKIIKNQLEKQSSLLKKI